MCRPAPKSATAEANAQTADAVAELIITMHDLERFTHTRRFAYFSMEIAHASDMTAAFNGGPNLSVLDGWRIEGCIKGATGWSIDDSNEQSNDEDAASLYRELAEVGLPLYYGNRDG